MRWPHAHKPTAVREERVRCPACGLTLPLAILGPRCCPRCAADRHAQVKLDRYAV